VTPMPDHVINWILVALAVLTVIVVVFAVT